MGHASDMNTDRSCSWTTDLDMVLDNSLGLDHILALGGSTVLLGQDDSGGSMATRPQVLTQTPCFMWPLVDINTDLSCRCGPQLQSGPGGSEVAQTSEISRVLGGKRSHGYQP